MQNSIESTQQEFISNFNFFENWLDKYQLLIDLGKKLPDFAEDAKIEANKIKGCQSNVWMTYTYDSSSNVLLLNATSDSSIVNGLIYLLLSIYNNHSPQEIINSKPNFIDEIGLNHHLSPTRKNGLYSMLQAIQNVAMKNIS